MVPASAPSTPCVSPTTGRRRPPQSEGSLSGRMCQAVCLPLNRPPAARGSSAHTSESQSQVQLSHKEAEALRLSILGTGLGCEQPKSRIHVHIIPLSPLSPEYNYRHHPQTRRSGTLPQAPGLQGLHFGAPTSLYPVPLPGLSLAKTGSALVKISPLSPHVSTYLHHLFQGLSQR